MNVLVVDDEKLNLLVAGKFINDVLEECELTLCSNPAEVLGILENSKIDIVLLDIIMPEISGIDVLRSIREKAEFNDIQVIMLTSMLDKEYFKTCFELGANDYILKPIDFMEFKSRLRASVKTRRNTLALKEMYNHINKQNTELKILNKKLEDTRFHMIQKEKLASIGELAAGVAHEINNPIGFIGSNLETMGNAVVKIVNVMHTYNQLVQAVSSRCGGDEELVILVETIGEMERKYKLKFVIDDLKQMITDSLGGIEKISKIVQSLRGFARTGMENEITFCDLNKIIEEVLLIIRNEAKYSIDIDCSFREIPEVKGNRGQIGQVVLNVLVNAIQAIKSLNREERGKIVISTYKEEGYACCSIEDNGPGMAKDIIGRIFDPFFTTKEVGMGTGLGLSISYDIIVKKHNGEFLVNSVPGEGSVFIFKLPDEMQDEVVRE